MEQAGVPVPSPVDGALCLQHAVESYGDDFLVLQGKAVDGNEPEGIPGHPPHQAGVSVVGHRAQQGSYHSLFQVEPAVVVNAVQIDYRNSFSAHLNVVGVGVAFRTPRNLVGGSHLSPVLGGGGRGRHPPAQADSPYQCLVHGLWMM